MTLKTCKGLIPLVIQTEEYAIVSSGGVAERNTYSGFARYSILLQRPIYENCTRLELTWTTIQLFAMPCQPGFIQITSKAPDQTTFTEFYYGVGAFNGWQEPPGPYKLLLFYTVT